jgi:three-Cys-motif partner protein
MTPSHPSEKAMASDGLLARDNGAWGKVKLSFLDAYLPPALMATRRKQQRHFVDLFAGPGRNIDARGTKEEFEGGTIRALRMTDAAMPPTSFTHLVAVNLDADDHQLLAERVHRVAEAGEARIPEAQRQLINGDANHYARFIIKAIDKRAYVLVFADPTAPKQFPFSTVQCLRADGHESVDLYMLYPGAALRRLFGLPEANADVLTRFYGGDGWRRFVGDRVTSDHFAELMRRAQGYYTDQLRAAGWKYARVVRDVRRPDTAALYEMILATNHPAADRIGAWAADKETTKDQLPLL